MNCVGVVDVLEFEARKQLADLQKEDIRDIGRLILSLSTRSAIDSSTETASLNKALSFVQLHYSNDVKALIVALLSKPLTIFEVCGMLTHHMMDELDLVTSISDSYESQLYKEFESGRSTRLLMKLNCVLERPELSIDKKWSETGDRYVLKLFRDFVFHQADSSGNPVLDLGHMVSSLNKLDTGDGEKICLVSRDGFDMLVVSYGDVARCLEGAYEVRGVVGCFDC